METYPRAAVERAMKIQEVILRAVAKKISWVQAGEIIGLCERQMRRWKERYEEFGYDGPFDRRLETESEARAFDDRQATVLLCPSAISPARTVKLIAKYAAPASVF